MSGPQYQPPQYQPPQYQPPQFRPPVPPRSNGLGVAALVVGIVSLPLATTSPLGAGGGICALVLGVLGLQAVKLQAVKRIRVPQGTSVAGTMLGVFAIIIAGQTLITGLTSSVDKTAAPITRSTEPYDDYFEDDQSTVAPVEAEPEVPLRDKSSAKKATLGAGTHAVPKKLNPGRYVITPVKGQSGNFVIYDEDDSLYVNEVLGGNHGVPSVTVDIPSGFSIKLRGVKAVFTPAETKLSTTLGAGHWVVGIDIPAGDYVASPAKGQSGNFVVYDADGWLDVNEILGGDYGVPDVTLSLTDMQVIKIRGISKVTFKADN